MAGRWADLPVVAQDVGPGLMGLCMYGSRGALQVWTDTGIQVVENECKAQWRCLVQVVLTRRSVHLTRVVTVWMA
jgi:hypothetical protein